LRRTRTFRPCAAAAAATLVVAACAPDSAADSGSFVARDSAGIVIVENSAPPTEARWSVPSEPELSLGVVEGEASLQFDEVRGVVRFDDGRIVVADGGSRQVRFFDPAGGFLRLAGGPGSGPGEFESITTVFRSAGDTLHVYDQVLRRVTVFDPGGQLARTTPVESPEGAFFGPRVEGVFDDGSYLLGTSPAFMFSGSSSRSCGAGVSSSSGATGTDDRWANFSGFQRGKSGSTPRPQRAG
jgi:hypothetical protein